MLLVIEADASFYIALDGHGQLPISVGGSASLHFPLIVLYSSVNGLFVNTEQTLAMNISRESIFIMAFWCQYISRPSFHPHWMLPI